jgi:hypothetical protein
MKQVHGIEDKKADKPQFLCCRCYVLDTRWTHAGHTLDTRWTQFSSCSLVMWGYDVGDVSGLIQMRCYAAWGKYSCCGGAARLPLPGAYVMHGLVALDLCLQEHMIEK